MDSLDPFSEGIVFSVRPPKKSWKNIANLSGGEKTLSSLALVFALHHYKPTPLYVMDEIDAALDFKNVSIVGHYIKAGAVVTAGVVDRVAAPLPVEKAGSSSYCIPEPYPNSDTLTPKSQRFTCECDTFNSTP